MGPFGRRVRSVLVAAVSILATRALAAAPPTAHLVVAREPGAESCPDASALAGRINGLTRRAAIVSDDVEASTLFAVRLARVGAGPGFAALVRAQGQRTGERRIEDAAETCAALVEATSLAIALILDPDFVPEAPAPSAPAPPPAPSPPPEAAAAAAVGTTVAAGARPPPAGDGVALAIGAGAAAGVAPGVTPALTAGIVWAPRPFLGVHAAVLWLPEGAARVAPGTVAVDLRAARVGLCAAPWPGRRAFRPAGCGEIAAGAIRGRGAGYAVDRTATRPFVAAGAALEIAGAFADRWRYFVQAGAVVPLRAQEFTIDNLGSAHRTASAAALGVAGVRFALR